MNPTGGHIVHVAREGGASSRAIKPKDQTLSNNGEHLNVGSLSETATSIKQIQTEQIKALTSNVVSVDEWRGETLCTAVFQNGRTTSNALKNNNNTTDTFISAVRWKARANLGLESGCLTYMVSKYKTQGLHLSEAAADGHSGSCKAWTESHFYFVHVIADVLFIILI